MAVYEYELRKGVRVSVVKKKKTGKKPNGYELGEYDGS